MYTQYVLNTATERKKSKRETRDREQRPREQRAERQRRSKKNERFELKLSLCYSAMILRYPVPYR